MKRYDGFPVISRVAEVSTEARAQYESGEKKHRRSAPDQIMTILVMPVALTEMGQISGRRASAARMSAAIAGDCFLSPNAASAMLA
jgi:hypothetical protein